MSTISVRSDREVRKAPNPKNKKVGKVVVEPSITELKKTQQAELKHGLTEAILISRGEMEGIPLSELWDE
jgi:hypothetical protein